MRPFPANRLGAQSRCLSNQEVKSNVFQEDPNSLRISNEECRYRLHHGSAFEHLLEARDQVLEHTFDFIIPFDPQTVLSNEGSLTDTDLHDHIF